VAAEERAVGAPGVAPSVRRTRGTAVTDWKFADVWEVAAHVTPEAPAVAQGARHLTWGAFDQRADGVASWLLSLGVVRQDKVALYTYNCPEYLEATFAATKVGLVPVNTNYRYADDELVYLWDNADAVAVVFHGAMVERIEGLRARVPGVRGWLWVDDGSGDCPDWAVPYEEAAAGAAPGAHTTAPWGRRGDDLIMLYTGGTTGMPKGVMWRQDDLFARMNAAGMKRYDEAQGLDDVARQLGDGTPRLSLLPACPLMHGTGAFTAYGCLSEGGSVVLLESRHYDPAQLLDTVEREQVKSLVIVGDPFARPLLATLDAEPDRWDLSSLFLMVSSGAMWSEEIKQGLLGHHPGMLLVDAFSSSEALGMGSSVSAAGAAAKTAEFVLGPEVRVLDPEGRPVEAGSDEVGVLALGGRNPLGYYKDPAKSDATFRVIDGVRYSIPGDYAQVRADGTIHLLGRGSQCINTAGEKVYPEEVEEVLKRHPAVADAAVVGVPHERFGEQIVAAVELRPDPEDVPPSEQELIEHVKGSLAHYKAPRRVRTVISIGRAPNGKLDYKRLRSEATDWMTAPA
jgi:fatty-acyl-CoA synthase